MPFWFNFLQIEAMEIWNWMQEKLPEKLQDKDSEHH